ncbi:MAG: GAF domain-containing protein [candidate division Zixibacteria bacterium]|nr:GAF domain-containing protein [candidate division Zixibacteria bacterium]
MKKERKSRNKKISKSTRLTERQKSLQANQSFGNLKINFEVLSGICKMMEQSTQERKAFEKVLNWIGKSVEFSQASLFLLDKKKNEMEEVASVGKKVDLIDFVRFDSGMGISAWVAKEKRPILLPNLHRKRGGAGIRSFLAIPLILNGELFGVINFSHIGAHAFEPKDVKFLSLISVPVTLSLERMFYHSELERLQKDLQQAREHSRQLEEKITRMESMIPTPQLLESLNSKIKTPLSSIAENAQFLLNSFSTRQEGKSSRTGKSSDLEFKRGLKQIKNEVNQITRTTERLLKRNFIW